MDTDAGPVGADPVLEAHDSTTDADQQAASPPSRGRPMQTPLTSQQHDAMSSSAIRPADDDEANTCRICRGESTEQEPLFFPCKCSGSIKYVHQECLMEWLSHSQKKYCELCKTSFRFTKLYHPAMPSRIPTTVFVRRAAVHILKLFMTWCRAVLVTSVWLLLLPWCMRVVWRSLFWLGDGGWTHDELLDAAGNGTTPVAPSPFDLDAVYSAKKAGQSVNTAVPLPLPSLMMPFSQTLNMSAHDKMAWSLATLFNFLHFSFPAEPATADAATNRTSTNVTSDYLGARSPSLLSHVTFLNWFPSQAANRFVVDVLEGQLITISVVVAFILIFLIREWVVQQQPVINMVALGDGVEAHPGEEGEQDIDDEDDDEDGEEDAREDQEIVPENVGEGALEEGEEPAAPEDEERARLVEASHRQGQVAGHAFQRAWRDSEYAEEIPEELRIAGTAEDAARAIEQLAPQDAANLKETLTRIAEQHTRKLRESTIASSSNAGASDLDPEASSAIVRAFAERPSSLPPDDTNAEGGPTSPSQRPALPPRDRSFIATEIRRGLEEGDSWSFDNVPQIPEGVTGSHIGNNVPDSWEDSEVERLAADEALDNATPEHEHNSDNSSDSWQQVPEPVGDGAGQDSSEGRGEANVTTGASDVSLDSIIDPPEAQRELIRTSSDNDMTADPGPHNDTPEVGEDVPQEPYTTPAPDLPARTGEEPVRNAQPPASLVDQLLDWVFGDVAPDVHAAEDVANDEHIVQNIADEAPFVPAIEPRELADLDDQDPEVAAAAAEAGIDVNDQDAIDDAEDLEGILELIGMQGPLTGLFQNAMFSAVLISASLGCAVWLPYLWGKLVILVMGSPVSILVKVPLQIVAILADLAVDGALCVAAGTVYWMLQAAYMFIRLCTLGMLTRFAERPIGYFAAPAQSIAVSARGRLKDLFVDSNMVHSPSYFRLSVNSHAALRSIQNKTSYSLNQTSAMVAALYEDAATESTTEVAAQLIRRAPGAVQVACAAIYNRVVGFVSWILTTQSYKITLDVDVGRDVNTAFTALDQWTATDRMIAVLAGYALFALIGAAYLKRGAPFTSSQQGQKVERIVAEVLQQAGGVLKVILIISIEMIIFPLYCGLLLDMALLPLFKDASLYSRWQFTRESPWTSGFVHWFLGTCYMFHFALFVSMCRKILRRGVLYFIRDPDDPTFHPVRDVLERSVTTQLRKIAFSGLVYGGLVIVCLGGVVWTLNMLTVGVLPIHWVSHAPSLEFPLDLLFYNFLTPVIIKVYKPSDALHAACQWWFKRCARFLRLSNFLFGDKNKGEEGRVGDDGEIVMIGKYVRAPASDQVRIPKGYPVFIEVDADNNRKDGKPEEGGVHNSPLVTMVYIPPWFRLRIAAFVCTIWIFAAITGVSVTIIPLIVGRHLFSLFLPARIEMNDIHAFSLGVYALGSIGYTIFQTYKFLRSINRPDDSLLAAFHSVAATASRIGLHALRFAYVWTGLIVLIPFLFAVLIELYLLMPLHAYIGPKEPHVVHLVQDWTLGFLYARLAARVIFSDRASRPARAFSAVIQNGYLYPNAAIATRCFLLPTVALFTSAIAAPSLFALSMNKTLYLAADATTKSQVWRFSYPAIGLTLVAFWAANMAVGVVKRWRLVVRDEVYLIGERLHNFGDKKALPAPPPVSTPVAQE
jgi:E3 ubiquitin-protein ligase MARCH6